MGCACWLIVGLVLGYLLGSRRVMYRTQLVFPRAQETVIIEVDRARIRTE